MYLDRAGYENALKTTLLNRKDLNVSEEMQDKIMALKHIHWCKKVSKNKYSNESVRSQCTLSLPTK